MTLLKHEPSAQIPWQKTMLGFVCVVVIVEVSSYEMNPSRTPHPSTGSLLEATFGKSDPDVAFCGAWFVREPCRRTPRFAVPVEQRSRARSSENRRNWNRP